MDDRYSINAEDRVVLIVEDDLIFAQLELDTAREGGMK